MVSESYKSDSIPSSGESGLKKHGIYTGKVEKILPEDYHSKFPMVFKAYEDGSLVYEGQLGIMVTNSHRVNPGDFIQFKITRFWPNEKNPSAIYAEFVRKIRRIPSK